MRKHFLQELDAVRQNLIHMGENTLAILTDANSAIGGANSGRAQHASELEACTDRQHRLIHDQCLKLITLQAPVARDARLVTGILDAIVDLELIGDYACEIVTISSSAPERAPYQVMKQLSDAATKIRDLLSSAIDAWRAESAAAAPSLQAQAVLIRAECQLLYERISRLVAGPGDATPYINLLLVCKHLERILRHAACVAEQAAGAVGAASPE